MIVFIELPDKNRTKDNKVNFIAEKENRIVITKDNDFLQTHLLYRK